MPKTSSRSHSELKAKSKVLLTGFEPFEDDSINSSMLAVKALHGKAVAGHLVVASVLPTVFGASLEALRRSLADHNPKLVICVGQSRSRPFVALERVAINMIDARIPDNSGCQPVDEAIVRHGPAAYFGTLPIKRIVAAMRKADVAAEVSQTAGTFVCNYIYYGLMHELSTHKRWKGTLGGFIHVPILQTPKRRRDCLPLDQIVKALELAIRTSLRKAA
jgi:pyroglutamyl-peptidase